MYSIEQVKKGMRSPRLIKTELIRQEHRIRAYRKFDYAVTGAYWNGNIGDRAISMGIKKRLEQHGKSVGLFHSKIEDTNSNVHVLGGGGVLRDCRAAAEGNSIDVLKHRLNWVSNAHRGAIIGVGVPGFKKEESKELVRNKLPKVDLITVRDHWSYENLEEFYDGEIHVTACPALLLEKPSVKSSKKTGVNFRPWPNYPSDIMSYHFDYDDEIDIDEARAEYIMNAKEICEKINDPVFIPFNTEDEAFAREHLNVDVLPYKFSVEKTLKRISAVDKMVSMRYHSLVFSAIAETPVLVVAYQPKVSSLAERLNIESYLPHSANIPLKFEKPSNVNKLKKLSNRNFNLMSKI